MTEYFKVEEVARKLRVSIHTIYSWIAQGKIPYVQIYNGTKRIPKAKFEAWIKKHSHDPDSTRL